MVCYTTNFLVLGLLYSSQYEERPTKYLKNILVDQTILFEKYSFLTLLYENDILQEGLKFVV